MNRLRLGPGLRNDFILAFDLYSVLCRIYSV